MCVNVEPCTSGALFSVASGQAELVSGGPDVVVAKKSSLLLSVCVCVCVCPVATQPVTSVEPLSTAVTVASVAATAIVTATISTSANTTSTTTTTTTTTASVSGGTAEHECRHPVHTDGSHQQLYTARPLLFVTNDVLALSATPGSLMTYFICVIYSVALSKVTSSEEED